MCEVPEYSTFYALSNLNLTVVQGITITVVTSKETEV